MGKKLLFYLTMALCLMSCEKFEKWDKNNRCIVTNEITPEEILPDIDFSKVISEENVIVVYEFEADNATKRYFVRSTSFKNFEHNQTQKFILDCRSKYVLAEYTLKVTFPDETYQITKHTNFYKISKETYVTLKFQDFVTD